MLEKAQWNLPMMRLSQRATRKTRGKRRRQGEKYGRKSKATKDR